MNDKYFDVSFFYFETTEGCQASVYSVLCDGITSLQQKQAL